jgi:hypothetical protein
MGAGWNTTFGEGYNGTSDTDYGAMVSTYMETGNEDLEGEEGELDDE